MYRKTLKLLGKRSMFLTHFPVNMLKAVIHHYPSLETPTYPVIIAPEKPSSITFQLRKGKRAKTGASEVLNLYRLMKLGLEEIQDTLCIQIQDHLYEPDFAYVNNELGIYADIEIDEPYTSGNRPTHYLSPDGSNTDEKRNLMFQKAGWHVFRFSEEQFYCHTGECMKLVYETLSQISPGLSVPASLLNQNPLRTTSRWTYPEALRMGRNHYRKTYLGFDPLRQDLMNMIKCVKIALPMACMSFYNRRVRTKFLTELKNIILK